MNHVLAAHMMIAVAPDMPVDQQIHLSETAKASDYIKRVGNKGFTLSSQDVRQSVSRSIPETRVTCVFRKTFIFNSPPVGDTVSNLKDGVTWVRRTRVLTPSM